VAGVEAHHPAVADDAHQAVGRQQDARLGQADAEVGGVHGQQQVEHHIAGQAQAEDLGGAAGIVIGAAQAWLRGV